MILKIENDGREITKTNFFEICKNAFFLSMNSRAFRLLLSANHEPSIKEMKTGEYAIISYADNGYDITFEDHTDYPFSLQSELRATDRIPLRSELPCSHDLILSIWIAPCNKVLEMPARVRRVSHIPCGLPWEESTSRNIVLL